MDNLRIVCIWHDILGIRRMEIESVCIEVLIVVGVTQLSQWLLVTKLFKVRMVGRDSAGVQVFYHT